MLPAAARLHTPDQYRRVTRSGRRGAAPTLVVHLWRDCSGDGSGTRARAGFVVSKKIGNSVVRHRVVRRLRAVVAAHLPDLPDGTELVIRALPAAADAPSSALGADFGLALQRAGGRKRR